MSEFLKDSGHNNMRTCDDCGGAFYCGDAPDNGEDAPDWKCETCSEKDAEIARLRAALKPFAEFAATYVPNAESFEAPEDYVVAIIHGQDGAKTINVGHLRASLKAMEGK
jgi:hypothetical protein